MVRRAQTSESRREPRVNEARCASFRRLGHCEQARDFRAKASKQQPAASTPIKRAHGPHGPPAGRSEPGRAASLAEEGLPRDGLRRPQRRRADRRRGDARDLRDLRVSPVAAAAAIPAPRLRRGWRRDGPLRDLGPGRWSFLRPYYRFCDIAACFTSGDVQIRHKRTTSHNKKVGRQQAEALVSRSGSGPLYDARRHYCHNS